MGQRFVHELVGRDFQPQRLRFAYHVAGQRLYFGLASASEIAVHGGGRTVRHHLLRLDRRENDVFRQFDPFGLYYALEFVSQALEQVDVLVYHFVDRLVEIGGDRSGRRDHKEFLPDLEVYVVRIGRQDACAAKYFLQLGLFFLVLAVESEEQTVLQRELLHIAGSDEPRADVNAAFPYLVAGQHQLYPFRDIRAVEQRDDHGVGTDRRGKAPDIILQVVTFGAAEQVVYRADLCRIVGGQRRSGVYFLE